MQSLRPGKSVLVCLLIGLTGVFIQSLRTPSAQAARALTLNGEEANAYLQQTGEYDSLAAAYRAATALSSAQNPQTSYARPSELRPPDEQSSAFGWAIAVSGNTAVVGVPFAEIADKSQQGAAYVFLRTDKLWKLQRKLVLEKGEQGDQFGYAVAIHGDTLVVGAPKRARGALVAAGAAYVFKRTNEAWKQEGELTHQVPDIFDHFGWAVAIHGNTVAVGAPDDKVGNLANRGSVSVFARSGVTWGHQATLSASDGAVSDQFGKAVALLENTIVAGAPFDDSPSAENHGSAYVFTRTNSAWTEQAKFSPNRLVAQERFGSAVALAPETLAVGVPGRNNQQGEVEMFEGKGAAWGSDPPLRASNGKAGDSFGSAVALNGNSLAIGAPTTDRGRGAAFVFQRSGNGWAQQHQFTPLEAAINDSFGAAVALSDDALLAGAPGDDVSVINQGSVGAFFRQGAQWTPQNRVTASVVTFYEELGRALAISGNTAVIGARGFNEERGAAYVFVRNGAFWQFEQRLLDVEGKKEDFFGEAVAISGNTIAVGADLDDNEYDNQGSVLIYTRTDAGWKLQQKLKARDGGLEDRFGSALALQGDTLVVGAKRDLTAPPNPGIRTARGSAYVFTRNNGAWQERKKLVADDGEIDDEFAFSLALDGDTLVAGAPYDRIGTNKEQGSAYVFTGSGGNWTQRTKLFNPNGKADDFFGVSVAVHRSTLAIGASEESLANAANAGATYVYTGAGANWNLQKRLLSPEPKKDGLFGDAVALRDDTLVVGAPGHRAAYVFKRGGSQWESHTKLGPNNPANADEYTADSSFGYVVALSENLSAILVGAPRASISDFFQGAAFVYDDHLPECRFALAPLNAQFNARGGTGRVNVTTTPNGCAWGALSEAPWIRLNFFTGTGNATVEYVVAPNPDGVTRTGRLVIAGQTFTVTQDGVPCVYRLGLPSTQAAATGGNYRFDVYAPAGCPWSAVSDAPWIEITDGVSAGGDGEVKFRVLGNTNTPRKATINVAGQRHIVRQASIIKTPQLTQLTPRAVRKGANDLTVTLTGEDFARGQRVWWNGVQCETQFDFPTQLKAVVPAALLANEGGADIRVTDAAGLSSNALKFRVYGAVAHASAASFELGSLAPESIVAAFGANLANETRVANSSPLPTELAGTSVLVRDSQGQTARASLFFVSPNQINYLMPEGLANGTATITITNGRSEMIESLTEIRAFTPGLFTAAANGAGAPAALALRIRANGEQVYEPVARYNETTRSFELVPIDLNDAAETVYLVLYGTGIRQRAQTHDVTVRVAGHEIAAEFAGALPGWFGLDQINVRLPANMLENGEQALTLSINDEPSNRVIVKLK